MGPGTVSTGSQREPALPQMLTLPKVSHHQTSPGLRLTETPSRLQAAGTTTGLPEKRWPAALSSGCTASHLAPTAFTRFKKSHSLKPTALFNLLAAPTAPLRSGCTVYVPSPGPSHVTTPCGINKNTARLFWSETPRKQVFRKGRRAWPARCC